jgi:uncharacterized protein (DUF1800 family)
MDNSHLNALRLGFSTGASNEIRRLGLQNYIKTQLQAQNPLTEPDFIRNGPKSLTELVMLREQNKSSGENQESLVKELTKVRFEWKAFYLQRCFETRNPLREKLNLFFQNHFVATLQSVKLPYWIFKYYETINNHSTGNYKTLVREMVYTNAMIKYLDNNQNKKGKSNENLARELLELFTLGEGNYTENDIKQTALALAGLTFGEEKGQYRPSLKDNSVKTVFQKSGNFIIDDVIERIFEQERTPYFISEKLLKWFFYDNPPPEKIQKYGALLKFHQFELMPFLNKLLEEECRNYTSGNQIKNPMIFLFQIHEDLNLKPNYKLMTFFLKNQGMDMFDQPNVKGWKGGRDWLTAQIYQDRKQLLDLIILGHPKYLSMLQRRLEKFDVGEISFQPKLNIVNRVNAASILSELTNRVVFNVDEEMQLALNQLLKYDFDPEADNADKAILNVYRFLAQSPEFQII